MLEDEFDFLSGLSARLAGGRLDRIRVDPRDHRFNGGGFGFIDRRRGNLHRRDRIALGVVSTIIELLHLPLSLKIVGD